MTTTEMDNDTRRDGVRTKASDAYYAARERTSSAYDSARDGASKARRKTSEGIDANPVAALIGGLALGGLLAAILPKTQREEEMLGDYSRQINERAREAARAAKEAGVSKLDELGYNKDNVKQKVETLKSDVTQIASAAAQRVKGDAKEVASAAAQNVKDTQQGGSQI